ncbi:prealbumin-like fold domain-containing protein, partial [Pediococcus claussenii]
SSTAGAQSPNNGTVNLVNNYIPVPGSVTLTKEDSKTATKLAGATFKLVAANGEVVKDNLITDANGTIEVADLNQGTYQFIETAAPNGYVLNSSPINFTIDGTGTNVNVSAINTAIAKTNIKVIKTWDGVPT